MKYFAAILIAGMMMFSACSKEEENTDLKPASSHMESNFDHGAHGSLQYTVPESWTRVTPSSNMRKDQFSLPGKDESLNAELAVFLFKGAGGDVNSNLER